MILSTIQFVIKTNSDNYGWTKMELKLVRYKNKYK